MTILEDTATVQETPEQAAAPADAAPEAEQATEQAATPPAAPKETPFDWRKAIAGSDEKIAKQVSRYNSAEDFGKAYIELQKKLSSGEHKKPLGADATPEQIQEYRKLNGIPETPDGYALPEDISFGEADQPAVKGFLEAVHGANASPATVNAALKYYHKLQEEAATAQYEADKMAKQTAEDELRTKWGGEYRENVNRINGLLDSSFPQDVLDTFKNARLGDGTPLFSNAKVLETFASLARDLNPVGSTISGKGMDNIEAINDRINELEKKMGTREWYNSPERAEHRKLLELQEKYK